MKHGLGEQLVGRRVVSLPGIAESPRDRREDDRGAQRNSLQRAHQVEPAVGLDVEDAVELLRTLRDQPVADLEAGGVQQDVDAFPTAAQLGERRLDGRGVAQIDLMIDGGAPVGRDGGHRGEGLRPPLDRGELPLDQHRGDAFAARLEAAREVALEPLPVAREAAEVGVRRIGRRGEIQQMEAAAAARQVAHHGRDDAAGCAGHHEDRCRAETQGGQSFTGRLLDQGDRRAQRVAPSDLDRAGVEERLVDQRLGDFAGRGGLGEVDALDQRRGMLARERLEEPDHGASERFARSGRVESEDAAEPGSAEGEAVSLLEQGVERAQHGRQELRAATQGLAPGGEIEPLEIPHRIEGGQPVEALDRSLAEPARDPLLHLLGGRRAVQQKRLHAARAQLSGERFGGAAAVGRDDHAIAGGEPDAGRPSELERRTENRDRDPARGWLRARWLDGGRGGGAGGCGGGRARREVGAPRAYPVEGLRQGVELLEPQVRVALDAVTLTHRGEDLRLLDGVDPQVRLEVEIEVEHLARIAGLLGDQRQEGRQDFVLARKRGGERGARRVRHGVARRLGGRRARRGCARTEVGPARVDELDRLGERREVLQLEVGVAFDAVARAHRREELGLLDGVDPEVGFEIEIERQQVARIAGLLGDQREHGRDHGVLGWRGSRCGRHPPGVELGGEG